MELQVNPITALAAGQAPPRQAARALGNLLRQTPEYTTFLGLLEAVNNDPTAQELAAQMRTHRNTQQWGRDGDGQHAAELARLELALEALPSFQAYRKAEAAVRQIFRAVDEIISHEAGVAFAQNAQRGGCGCGG